jgi:hypothetical protein
MRQGRGGRFLIVIGVSTLLGPLPVPFDERVKARFADVVDETVVVLAGLCCLL